MPCRTAALSGWVPDKSRHAAEAVIDEIGMDMSRFPHGRPLGVLGETVSRKLLSRSHTALATPRRESQVGTRNLSGLADERAPRRCRALPAGSSY